ncbi:MAG: type 1 glutamine amidotransferase [Proteobacteria bacterium]|nr:MAG: type 1 glutamine amidotransferase [Pseudomonadota bacterium]
MLKPVLFIQHAPHEHPAVFKRALDAMGVRNRIFRAFEGQPLPSVDEIGGLISLGGPMSANDEADHWWLLPELILMKRVFDRGLPLVGICLGGQMLARTLGGKVIQNPHPEIGWFQVHRTELGLKDLIFKEFQTEPSFYQWHYDTFLPPEGAQILAESPLCPRQAYRMNERTYGFQFHPEVDYQLIHEWLSVDGTDEEILQAKMAHHEECVQEPALHLNLSKNFQIDSLRLISGLSSLFRPDIERVRVALPNREEILQPGKIWSMTVQDGFEREFPIMGRALAEFAVGGARFVFIQDASNLTWPVREDLILQFSEV